MSGKCRASLRAKTLENVKRSLLSQADKNCIAEVFERYEKSLDLINRKNEQIKQKDEQIEDLEAECEKQYEAAEATIRAEIASGGKSCHWCEDIIKRKARTEAIKEFADRAKKEGLPKNWLDQIAKEMGVE